MEERSAADRANLAVAEETAQGYISQLVVENVRVVVRFTVKVFTSSKTREQQGTGYIILSVVIGIPA